MIRATFGFVNGFGVRRGDWQGVEVQIPYGEGVAIHIGPEQCADVRKGACEASAKCTGQPSLKRRCPDCTSELHVDSFAK
jgi:hypothetical protein